MSRKHLAKLSIERLRYLLDYDLETGIFRWKVIEPPNHMHVGDIAGSTNGKKGYLRIRVDGVSYMQNVLAWMYVYGEIPKGRLAHLNYDRSDVRISNLILYSDLNKSVLSQSLLKTICEYTEDGQLISKVTRWGLHPGDRIGYTDRVGYVRAKIANKNYMLHNLVWIYHNGEIPEGYVVDHMNCIKCDNRIENFRLVLPRHNCQNERYPRSTNELRILGVSHHKYLGVPTGRYRSTVTIDGVKHYLGLFPTPELAHQAYVAAKRKLHPYSTL